MYHEIITDAQADQDDTLLENNCYPVGRLGCQGQECDFRPQDTQLKSPAKRIKPQALHHETGTDLEVELRLTKRGGASERGGANTDPGSSQARP